MSNEAKWIEQCHKLRAKGDSNEEIVSFLRSQGYSKTQSIALVAKALNLSLAQAKELVHDSCAWADVRQRDELFHDAVEKNMKKDN